MRHFFTEATSRDVADGSRTHIARAVDFWNPRRLSMRFVILTLLAMTSVTTVAIAQDGNGHGPPKSPIVVMPRIPVPMPATSTTGGKKFFQPASELALLTK